MRPFNGLELKIARILYLFLRCYLAFWVIKNYSPLMIDEDLDPRNPTRKPKSLDSYSIDELHTYIDILKSEITRVELDIQKKKAHRDAVAGLFKSKGD